MKERANTNLRSKTIARGSQPSTLNQSASRNIISKRSRKSQKEQTKERQMIQGSHKKRHSLSPEKQLARENEQQDLDDVQSQHSHESAPIILNKEQLDQIQQKANSASNSPRSNVKPKDTDMFSGQEESTIKKDSNARNFDFLLEVRQKADKDDQEIEIAIDEEVQEENLNKVSDDLDLSEDSIILQLNKISENQQITPQQDGEQKFYTLGEDLYIIALVQRWQAEKTKGNPFKQKYFDNYTKIRGRTCESIRDRYKRFLKFLSQENINELRKALNELGPISYIHFLKQTTIEGKNIKVYKGVFAEPPSVQNQIKNPEIKEKMKQSLSKSKKKSSVDKTPSSDTKKSKQKKPIETIESRLERQLIYDDKTQQSNLKKRLHSEQEQINQKQFLKPPPLKSVLKTQEKQQNKKLGSLAFEKSPQQDEGVQVSEIELSGMKLEYGTPANTKSGKQYLGSVSTGKQISKIKVKPAPLRERIKWLSQLDKEDKHKEQLQPVKRTKIQLKGKKLKSLIPIHIAKEYTNILLNERYLRSDQEIRISDDYRKFQKQEIFLKFKGFGMNDREVDFESRITPILREKLEGFASRYLRDVQTVLEDLVSVSGDFQALTQYYEHGYSHLVWLSEEDQILINYLPNEYQFKVLLHNKGEENVLKRIKFLGINKTF